jgi:phosphomannomutase/phosphoglucomutase
MSKHPLHLNLFSPEMISFMKNSISQHIFKAYDIRGVVGTSLTDDSVFNIGKAIGSRAKELGNTEIIVGRDGRLSGQQMVTALSRGIVSTGINVIDIGMVPTPVVYFATYEIGTGASVSVTGSHNPPEYNGFKIMLGGNTLSGEEIQLLRRRIESNDLEDGNGSIRSVDVTQAYVDRIAGDINIKKKLKVVMDCGNGVAGNIAPQLFRKLGIDIVELYTEVDGTFPNHHPDPIDEKNLLDLKRITAEQDADFGIAFDGDGDRLGLVTAEGETIWPDRQMILFSRDVLSRSPGAEIIYDVKCTRSLPQAIEAAGGKATMYKTGHSLIKSKLKESGAALAGEMSGHIFFKERWFGFDDGLYAGARLCELVSNQNKKASELFNSLPDMLNTPELRLDLKEGEQHQLIEELVAIADFADAIVHTIDGLRVDYEWGFGLARASNTTPTVIMRFEADSRKHLDRLQDEFRVLIQLLRPGIALPF